MVIDVGMVSFWKEKEQKKGGALIRETVVRSSNRLGSTCFAVK
ncbi:hypothetical protein COLO4_05003 [Corchorus olitorius]|uniref:Uncharacterized protein n=1 Tax=Corchorus olitorius TaxID=93759 RepID=A0A1R3KS56_9ROSI|nr:hypothetical protein COLO4_05003 [Corchorus olitorius]